jgi:putative thioredoxin
MTPHPEPQDSFVYDVTDADFEMSVLDRSIDVPVLLDCWAPWCGPCKSLTPVLEKLAKEYNGRFVLAKLNTDENPQIAAALRIRSIPMVTLLKGGRPVDQFMGALPEGQVRQFLDHHLGPAPEGAPEGEAEGAEFEPGPLDEAALLIDEGALDDAKALLDTLPEELKNDERHAKLLARIKLASERPQGDAAALVRRIESNRKDHEARFQLAAIHAHAGDFGAAFEQLLEIVLRDKDTSAEGWREKARRQLVEWFEVCPDPEVVSHGRRYLGMYLN